MIFIGKAISFTWTLVFSKASVCAKIDKKSKERGTQEHMNNHNSEWWGD